MAFGLREFSVKNAQARCAGLWSVKIAWYDWCQGTQEAALAYTAHIDPFVDWTMTIESARRTSPEEERKWIPVFFEGDRDTINALFVQHDIPVFLPASSGGDCTMPCAEGGRQPLYQDSTLEFCFAEEGQVAGFYFVQPQHLHQMAEVPALRALIKGAGVPVCLDPTKRTKPLSVRSASAASKQTPIVAVIDDGIGYLNARFRKRVAGKERTRTQTRFLGLWQQSIQPVQDQCPYVKIGRVLSAEDIEADLCRLGLETEFDVYRSRNAEIFSDFTHRSTEQAFSHGTAILDLAAGLDPKDGAEGADLLAVQLPPETLEDTSGTHLPVFLLMAVDWLLSLAYTEARSIIINVSLGFSAGTKTGESLLERQLRSRIACFNEEMNNAHAGRLVFAYGNSYRERLAARFDLDDALAKGTMDWNIPPDDPTHSFLQIHRIDQVSSDLSAEIGLSLASPSGTVFTVIPPVDQFEDLVVPDDAGIGQVIGRIYHDRLEGTSRLTIALAPTTGSSGLLTESGTWKVTVQKSSAQSVSLVLQVQRDDTAAGFERGGRQSFLDHRDAYGFDPRTYSYDAPEGASGLTRNGTNSAIMAKGGAGIVTAGAIEPDPMGSRNAVRPTLETAGSADWSQRTLGAGPTHSTIGSDGYGSYGVVASGTFSDTTVVVDGTSVAAAKITRDLSNIAPTLEAVPDAARTNRIGEVRVGAGGARPRHPES